MSEYADRIVRVGERTYRVLAFRGKAEKVEVRFSIGRCDAWGIAIGKRDEWRCIWMRGAFRAPPAGRVTRAAVAAAGAII